MCVGPADIIQFNCQFPKVFPQICFCKHLWTMTMTTSDEDVNPQSEYEAAIKFSLFSNLAFFMCNIRGGVLNPGQVLWATIER